MDLEIIEKSTEICPMKRLASREYELPPKKEKQQVSRGIWLASGETKSAGQQRIYHMLLHILLLLSFILSTFCLER